MSLTLLWLPAPWRVAPHIVTRPFLRHLETPQIDRSPYPKSDGKLAPPQSARGIYILDVNSMVPMYQKNPDDLFYPASTTKIMTALVALDAFAGQEVVTSPEQTGVTIGKTMKLTSGEQIGFEDLLYGLLLESGNDAAFALAQNYPGGYSMMVDAMNRRAKDLGLSRTTFHNVSGLDQPGHQTSPHDLAILSAVAMTNAQFATAVGTREKTISSVGKAVIHRLQNTNELLGTVPGVIGIKTGWTDLAGENLVTEVDRDGHRVIIVILSSAHRFDDTRALINWVFNHHDWESPISATD